MRWVMEVDEEIGFDASPLINEKDSIEVVINEQRMKLYIIWPVDQSLKFVTKTRKEISVSTARDRSPPFFWD
jgi:hypothetical protein